MSRLTLRLPDSLHDLLAARAEEEGVSLNHYLVYTLTRAAAVESVAAQRRAFEKLTSRVADDEAEASLQALLAARE